nr:MAG TPA: hypothetical protein [Caudoviricetes sp.]
MSRGRLRLFSFSPLRSPEVAPLVGFGATPQLFLVKPTPREKSTRRRQRSVPASNFAHPQMRPPTRFILFPDKNAPRCAANFSFWLT